MGDHLVNGRFVSDRFRILRRLGGADVTADKLVLSFRDPKAWLSLKVFANLTEDEDLARDIKARLKAVERLK